jgi:hypothetical protein
MFSRNSLLPLSPLGALAWLELPGADDAIIRSPLCEGSESNDVWNGCQPQYPDLQGKFNIDFTRLQGVWGTTRHIPGLTRQPTHRLLGY